METRYRYQDHIPQYYNITSKLVDENVAKGLGDKIAIYYRDKTYTYSKIQQLINKVGNALLLLGTHMEDRVVLAMNDSPEAIASFYGAIKIGAVPVPLNPLYTADEYRLLLNNSRARCMIIHEEYLEEVKVWKEKLLYLRNIVVVSQKRNGHISFWDLVDHCSDELDVAYTTMDDQAFWNYTSGSLGVPKAAVHLQHDVFSCINNYARAVLGLRSEDILLSGSKFFFTYGLGNSVFYPFGLGASVVLLPDRLTPDTLLSAIDTYRPTVFFGVPSLYASMLQFENLDKYDLSSLRICTSAGEALPKDLFGRWKERFGTEILDGVGSTELLHIFISNRPGDVKPGSSGKLVPGYSARIVDEQGKNVADGQAGTLFVEGESTAAYYWRHHEKTKKSMLGEWFNTGDKYCRDKDGYFTYRGRDDDMLKVSGVWVSPVEVEDALLAHPAVLRAAVVPFRDKSDLVKPKAYIVPKPGYKPGEELAKDIQGFVKQTVAPFKYPRKVEFIKEMPVTSTGKIQRYKLR
ncbi:MAG TPA: benzoate-CoA ligase family protein [Syntrophorhabdaceae bacterium]|nr:benzoate-CoA ligase family protein [Syntrophorhabdaceae bacterium]